MPRQLPANPSLEHLKNQAKDLLKAIRAGDADATRRLEAQLPQNKPASRQRNLPHRFTLADAQLAIARECGFLSWPKLKAYVETIAPATVESKQKSPLQKIKSAHWVETWHHYREHPHSSTTEVWIRADPPARAWINRSIPGPNVNEEEWSHRIRDERGDYSTASTWDICTFSPARQQRSVENLLWEVLAPDIPEDADVSKLPYDQQWKIEPVEVNGRPLIRYDLDYIQGNFRIQKIVWAEPDTRRLVRVETQQSDAVTGQPSYARIRDQFTYNEAAPAGVFEMPADKPLVTNLEDISPEVWEDLSQQDRQAIQKTIDRSDNAWKNADFRAFASVWDFDYMPHLPLKAEWQARIKRYARLWRGWQSEIQSAEAQDYIPVSIASHAFSMGPGLDKKETILNVTVRLHTTWADDGDTWEGRAEYFLRRKGKGFQIVHWEAPWEQIKATHEFKRAKVNV